MLQSLLNQRALPPILALNATKPGWEARRKEIIDQFAAQVYGVTPPSPPAVNAATLSEHKRAWGGAADHYQIALSFDAPKGAITFPVELALPISEHRVPLFIFITFRKPCLFECPIEEILEGGYGVAAFCYEDITSDDGDMKNGLAALHDRAGDNKTCWGKIGMWAYAASRVMDYALTLERVDQSRISCLGHSRLGKTSLWCAAQDTRFFAAFINNSGCSGAAVTRGKQGEKVRDICTTFPYWFCENYRAYIDRENDMPFDQHQLMATLAPRLAYTASAVEDIWADPNSEYLSSVAASEAYRMLGLSGLVHPNRLPAPGDIFHEGEIGFHLRSSTHFLSRYDWIMFMRYLNKRQKGR